jgi:hypothetical protein
LENVLMEPVQQKFASFMASLSPEEQRAVVPLMTAFVGTMGAPSGADGGDTAPPLPPPGTEPMLKPPAAPPQTAIPGGPPLPPPDPVAMSIGRQVY